MTTVNTIRLPSIITINGVQHQVNNWQENGNLDGFRAEITDLPINEFETIAELEFAIWTQNYISADIKADGSGVIYIFL